MFLGSCSSLAKRNEADQIGPDLMSGALQMFQKAASPHKVEKNRGCVRYPPKGK